MKSQLPFRWGKATRRASKDFVVADIEGLDPALLAEGEADEESELDYLGSVKCRCSCSRDGVIREGGVPDDGAGIGERGLFALAEFVRLFEMQQSGVLRLRNAPRSRPDRTLHA